MMIIYLIILGMSSFVPAISKNFIRLVVYLNSHVRKQKKRNYSLVNIFNVKLFSFLILTYFISLVVMNNQQLAYLSSYSFVLIIITIFALFILQDTFSGDRSNADMLISLAIFHIYIMSLSMVGNHFVSDQSEPLSLFYWLRYGSLLITSIVVIVNYVLNSVVYGKDFWSVTDLLVVFILVGMIGIQPLGIGFPFTFSFEVGLIYFANKLWLPLFSEFLAKSRLTA